MLSLKGISLTGFRVRGRSLAASVAALFAGGEPGVWYDPSDLTTLFQDSTGITPVTDATQPVGLVLDKSQGLTLGPELTTNGTFDTDTGWIKEAGWTISGGKATKSGGDGSLYQPPGAVTQGKTYRVTFDVSDYTGGTMTPFIRGGHSGLAVTANGSYSLSVVAGADGTYGINFYGNAAFAGSIDNVSVKLLPGNHATQSTAAARPTYQTDGTLHWLQFDGVDDFLVTPTITPGTDKVQVFAGLRKLSDAAAAVVAELSSAVVANNGTFNMLAPLSAGNYRISSKGTSESAPLASGFTAPTTNIVTGIGDISGDTATIRVDGTQAAQSTTNQGTGNFLAYPMYIGRRGGTSLPYNGHLYSLITRFGPNLDATAINKAETYIAGKTGVTL